MPHIHTEPGQHDATASAFIIRTDMEQPRVLFHMHKKLHKLLQPGGHVELHETPWQAILHELVEETGYEKDQLRVLQPDHRIKELTGAVVHPVALCQNTHSFSAAQHDHFHSDTSYAFIAESEPRLTPVDGESMDLRWLTKEQLASLSNTEVGQNSREIALFALDYALAEWQPRALDEFFA